MGKGHLWKIWEDSQQRHGWKCEEMHNENNKIDWTDHLRIIATIAAFHLRSQENQGESLLLIGTWDLADYNERLVTH
jgi:hypothetical protein